MNNASMPLLINPYDLKAAALSTGRPSYLFRDGVFSMFKRFVDGSTLSSTSEDKSEKKVFLHLVDVIQDVINSGTGTRKLITGDQLQDILVQSEILKNMVDSLLAVKVIADMLSASTIGEIETGEMTVLRRELELFGQQFEETYGPTLRSASQIKLPAPLCTMISTFHSPFLMDEGSEVLCCILDDPSLFLDYTTNGPDAIISAIETQINSIRSTYTDRDWER